MVICTNSAGFTVASPSFRARRRIFPHGWRKGTLIVSYYVYIMSNASKTLYVGVTNDLLRRIIEHRNKTGSSFVRKCNVTKLVYLEETGEVDAAIAREKQIKGWLPSNKQLLTSARPGTRA